MSLATIEATTVTSTNAFPVDSYTSGITSINYDSDLESSCSDIISSTGTSLDPSEGGTRQDDSDTFSIGYHVTRDTAIVGE
jgi:hypothetical protein